jgi:hypothetical protein
VHRPAAVAASSMCAYVSATSVNSASAPRPRLFAFCHSVRAAESSGSCGSGVRSLRCAAKSLNHASFVSFCLPSSSSVARPARWRMFFTAAPTLGRLGDRERAPLLRPGEQPAHQLDVEVDILRAVLGELQQLVERRGDLGAGRLLADAHFAASTWSCTSRYDGSALPRFGRVASLVASSFSLRLSSSLLGVAGGAVEQLVESRASSCSAGLLLVAGAPQLGRLQRRAALHARVRRRAPGRRARSR